MLLIAAVQFINILDFVMVSPLGPLFAMELQMANSQLNLVSSSYTAAAMVAGLAGLYFLDRFDRRKALAVSMLGLALGTAAGGLAWSVHSVMVARVIAGLFGGPATSLALSIVADMVPVERRGRAMGTVMTAFSVAQVLGMPIALLLAQWGGWRTPFFAVGLMGLAVMAGAIFMLPPMRAHLEQQSSRGGAPPVGLRQLFTRKEVLESYLMTTLAMMGGFLLIPNIPTYLLHNLSVPQGVYPLFFVLGGIVSFITLRVAGRRVDRLGPQRVGLVGSLLLMLALYLCFINVPLWGPLHLELWGLALTVPRWSSMLLPIATLYIAMGTRNVSVSTLASRVPENAIRARFMSMQSAVQHFASTAAGVIASLLLSDLPDGRLAGLDRLVWVSMALTLLLPWVMLAVERRVLAREHASDGLHAAAPLHS